MKQDSLRCETTIHRRRILTDGFDLLKRGMIPEKAYEEASLAIGQKVI